MTKLDKFELWLPEPIITQEIGNWKKAGGKNFRENFANYIKQEFTLDKFNLFQDIASGFKAQKGIKAKLLYLLP